MADSKVRDEALAGLLSTAKALDAEVASFMFRLEEKEADLERVINEFNQARTQFVFDELGARDLVVCTWCGVATEAGKATLMFHEGVSKEEGDAENGCYGYHDFHQLHNLCPNCHKRAAEKHGYMGRYDSSEKVQPYFHAFKVLVEGTKRYVIKFGQKMQLDDKYHLPEIPEHIIERLADDWSFPKQLRTRNGRLVIPAPVG